MYLHSLATAVPPTAYTQKECAEMLQRSDLKTRLNRRSLLTLLAILRGDSGITTRHFAMPDIEHVFSLTPDELYEGFRREAPLLASRALREACDRAAVRPADIDALLICTCTGYLCPGVTSYVAEELGMRSNAILQDVVGLGCGAAIPTFRAADALLARHPGAIIATVAVEICSAAFYIDDDLGVLVSACLFGDGAAAAIWKSTAREDLPLRCHSFNTRHEPAHRDKIRFEQRNGKLRNLLDPGLPPLAASAVSHLLAGERENAKPIARILSHGGGRDVLDALDAALPDHDLTPSRDVLRRYGNMSSPSVLFALNDVLGRERPADTADWWLVSFGAGFSAHSCRIGV